VFFNQYFVFLLKNRISSQAKKHKTLAQNIISYQTTDSVSTRKQAENTPFEK